MAMVIELEELEREPGKVLEFTFEENFESFDYKGEKVNFSEEVFVEGGVVKVKEGFMVWGEATTTLKLHCSRCLELFSFPVKVEFEVEYRRGEEQFTSSKERSLNEDDFRISYFAGENIDIEGDIRQFIILSIPMKPLCKEDCKGLCPVCGKNLNEGDCGCERDVEDPRWSALKGLMKGGVSDGSSEEKNVKGS
ncbi:MAG: DUF177 domain-containing protein [Synergistetes bacterium]|nr:DUF177 domain-containing protein [Synergistota bacterium]MCX8127193.1 DUF177 domain-containing protein [Synergistota bacterium]MDW8191921.1 DUF177 domain-containing protein [Synergistota bacterium]